MGGCTVVFVGPRGLVCGIYPRTDDDVLIQNPYAIKASKEKASHKRWWVISTVAITSPGLRLCCWEWCCGGLRKAGPPVTERPDPMAPR